MLVASFSKWPLRPEMSNGEDTGGLREGEGGRKSSGCASVGLGTVTGLPFILQRKGALVSQRLTAKDF